MMNLTLIIAKGTYAVCRLAPDAPIAAWAAAGPFISITRSERELSIVCLERDVPPGVTSERGWRRLEVAGPLYFSLVGVLAALVDPLAHAGIPVFAVSTFDTDHLLIRAVDLDLAVEALKAEGHTIGGAGDVGLVDEGDPGGGRSAPRIGRGRR
jgi:hypothetical protein